MKKHAELPEFTKYQLQIINGSLLGDASLTQSERKPTNNWRFCKQQSIKDKDGVDKLDYLTWHHDQLFPYSTKIGIKASNKKPTRVRGKIVNEILNGDPSHSYCFYTHAHPNWTKLAEKWYKRDIFGNYLYKNNKIIKIIPTDLILSSLVLAIWFMDDGILDSKNGRAIVCTNCFSESECQFLVSRLFEDLKIISKVSYKDGYPIIYIGVNHYKRLIEIIEPHIEWECYKYKHIDLYNKTPPRGQTHYKAIFVESDVIKMIQLRSQGEKLIDIAEKFDTDFRTVHLIVSGKTWKHLKVDRPPPIKPRITKEVREEVYKLKDSGVSVDSIANMFDISKNSVRRIFKKVNKLIL